MKKILKAILPASLLGFYHLALAEAGALLYRYPSRSLVVVGVTGTKGKSTTVELIDAMLREAGYKTAVASTIHFTIAGVSEPNLFKMTMPGRFFLQKFLRNAVSHGVTHAVIEMTSEGAKQFRHVGIEMDALVFLNLAPEHLESHGGMKQYAEAKLSLARHLSHSPKRPRIIVANADDEYGKDFLAVDADVKAPFSLADAEPYNATDRSLRFVWRGGELFTVPLPGLFNLKNALAALTLCDALGVPLADMKRALESVRPISGRAERVECGQPFSVIVDYAHTPDSLKALFETYKDANRRMICVLGSTGGGRDTWNRPEKGKLAEEFCDVSIVTDEDPYDEDPKKILSEVAKGFTTKKPFVIESRRSAIREALKEAKEGDVVLLTGKGTDPYIMRARGVREAWSDKKVVSEELHKLGYH